MILNVCTGTRVPLDGLATTWVLGRPAPRRCLQRLRIIDAFDGHLKVRWRILERENAQLKAKLQALHRRRFRQMQENEETGGEDLEAPHCPTRKKRKRGAPIGHPGWVRRKPERIDRTVDVPAPTICPHCQSEHLRPMRKARSTFRKIS